jgi:ATP synthase protein I
MTAPRLGRGLGRGGQREPDPDPRMPREGTGWAIVSYLIGGMLLYGGIGWLVGRWTHIAVLFPIGILLGIGLSLALVVFRFTRS